jgi:non-ribosomal peptide synthase protein (TIGR01720 family)
LQIVWRYSRHLHQPGTIEQLAQRYLTALHSILAYGQERQPRAASYTPADFPAARLNQAQLDRLLSTLHQREP